MISKDNDFILLWLRFLLFWLRGAVVHDKLLWKITGCYKVLECFLSDEGGNPVIEGGCLRGHCEERILKRKKEQYKECKARYHPFFYLKV